MTSVKAASRRAAHVIDAKPRTEDVLGAETADFSALLLSSKVLEGLRRAGFLRPSPIQLKAIPLGKCGLDMIVQAKSGTGKTCVFSVIALEGLSEKHDDAHSSLQTLILAPTREIAVQIRDVIAGIAVAMSNVNVEVFIGGMPVKEDMAKLSSCHIAIGTPGRIKQLIESGHMATDSLRLFVLDEADKLFDPSFTEVINWIYSRLPANKQVLALSATYPEHMAHALKVYMQNPILARLDARQPVLLGIRQFFLLLPRQPSLGLRMRSKMDALLELLSQVSFNQCLVFSNLQSQAQHLAATLSSKGWPASHISGGQDQASRLFAMSRLKAMQIRVLVSTDLTSRGIDVENIDLIVNLDVPSDAPTYLHRIGRAGRFGSYGVAITLACAEDEEQKLLRIMSEYQIPLLPVPKTDSGEIPSDLVSNSSYWDKNDLDSQLELLLTDQMCRGFTEKKKKRIRKNVATPQAIDAQKENVQEPATESARISPPESEVRTKASSVTPPRNVLREIASLPNGPSPETRSSRRKSIKESCVQLPSFSSGRAPPSRSSAVELKQRRDAFIQRFQSLDDTEKEADWLSKIQKSFADGSSNLEGGEKAWDAAVKTVNALIDRTDDDAVDCNSRRTEDSDLGNQNVKIQRDSQTSQHSSFAKPSMISAATQTDKPVCSENRHSVHISCDVLEDVDLYDTSDVDDHSEYDSETESSSSEEETDNFFHFANCSTLPYPYSPYPYSSYPANPYSFYPSYHLPCLDPGSRARMNFYAEAARQSRYIDQLVAHNKALSSFYKVPRL